MLPLPDHLTLPKSELESQQEHQGINIQNCSQHSEDDISHPIEGDTVREPSNYKLQEGRLKRIHRPPAYLKDYVI